MAAAGVALTVSCDPSDVLAPVDPDRIAITIAVTGGFASADYAFTVDGSDGEVRGVRCVALCDFAAGELLAVVSDGQVAYLSQLLDRAGAIGLDGRDFGQGCCDFNEIDLVYERGDRSAHVTGTEDRLPEALQDAVSAIVPLVRGVPPVIIAPGTIAEDWPRDPYTLGDVNIDGSILRADVTYSGGCERHPMDLVLWGGWLESFPVQINALITHDDRDDPCDAIVSEDRAFDLRGLARAYAEAYGSSGGAPLRVILRLADPTSGAPTRSIEIEL